MKKLLYLLILSVLVIMFTGCRSESESIGFMSILDTELGEVFTLGDTQESIREILGEPVRIVDSIENRYFHEYGNGLRVEYVDGRAVVFFTVASALEEARFEILGYSTWMTNEQIADNFVLDEASTDGDGAIPGYNYRLFYDESGNVVDMYYAHVEAGITLWYGFFGEQIVIRILFTSLQSN